MKRINFLIGFFLMLSSAVFSMETGNVVDVLSELDMVIETKSVYEQKKEDYITMLKGRLQQSMNNYEKYELCNELFKAYLHYQADSALVYAERKSSLLPLSGRPELEQEVLINKAEILGIMGLYVEATNLLGTLDTSNLSEATLGKYYGTMRACYGWWADYVSYPEWKAVYLKKTEEYRDSLLVTNVADRNIVMAEKYMLDGNEGKAITILKEMMAGNPETKQKAYINYTLYEIY